METKSASVSVSEPKELEPMLLSPPITAKVGSMGEWTMTKKRLQDCFLNKEIPLKTYIKWAILFDHGEVSAAKIDVSAIIQDWSFEGKNYKGNYVFVNLEAHEVLTAIASLAKESRLDIVSDHIQLNLNLWIKSDNQAS